MAKHEVLIGQTDYTVLVFIPDPASTDGSGKTGLVAANLTVSGVRVETDNDVTVTDYTGTLNNLASLTAAHADWGVYEVSNTLAPGLYRLDIADALFAAGAWSCVVYVMVTSSAAAASPMEFVLVPSAPLTGVLLAPVTHTSAVIPTVTAVGTLTTYTGNTPQTGDSYARIGATGSGLTTLASQASVDDLPTNAELATALGTADDATLAAIAALNNLSQANIRTAVGLGSANLDTQLGDLPTNAELATALGTADDAVLAAIAALNNLSAAQVNTEVDTALADINLDHLVKIAVDTDFATTVHLNSVVGQLADNGTSATFDRTTDSQEAIRDRGDAAWVTGTALDAAGVRTAIGLASANLDTQLDALPTNTELATALGTADDATLAAIAALNNLSQANIRTAVGLGSANLDTQLGDLPTNAELATALGTADDAVLAAIAALNNLSAGAAMTLTTGERNAIADAHLDRTDGVETGVTVRQSLRLANAANAGKVDGMATTTVHLRDLADTKNRVTATVDADGNRTAITRDLT